jgi:hypothetical protein
MIDHLRIDHITILNCTILAGGSSHGSGIGTGFGEDSSSMVRNLTMSNGSLKANGSLAGIGSGA